MTATTQAIEVVRNRGGWSERYNPRTTRQYAVKINGVILRTAAGAIRTFTERAAAQAAGEEAARG